jgi:hypothetical protein
MSDFLFLQISFGCIVAGVVLILLSIEPLHKANKRATKKASPVRKGRRRRDAADEGTNRAGDPGISTDYLEQASLEDVRYSFIYPGTVRRSSAGHPCYQVLSILAFSDLTLCMLCRLRIHCGSIRAMVRINSILTEMVVLHFHSCDCCLAVVYVVTCFSPLLLDDFTSSRT